MKSQNNMNEGFYYFCLMIEGSGAVSVHMTNGSGRPKNNLRYGSYRSGSGSARLFLTLKGPKREIFVAGIFAQIRPIWIGDLGTRPKNRKKLCLGP